MLKPAGTFWLAIGDEYAAELKLIFHRELGLTLRSWVIWYYTFGVNCTRKFSRCHAHLFHFVKDPKRFTFNDEAIRVPSARQLVYADARANPRGRLPDDTWILRPQDVPDGFAADDDTWYFPRVCGTFKERAGWHGCQMPEQLLGRIIRACTDPGDLVLDPFAGSGTTLAVAKKLGRRVPRLRALPRVRRPDLGPPRRHRAGATARRGRGASRRGPRQARAVEGHIGIVQTAYPLPRERVPGGRVRGLVASTGTARNRPAPGERLLDIATRRHDHWGIGWLPRDGPASLTRPLPCSSSPKTSGPSDLPPAPPRGRCCSSASSAGAARRTRPRSRPRGESRPRRRPISASAARNAGGLPAAATTVRRRPSPYLHLRTPHPRSGSNSMRALA